MYVRQSEGERVMERAREPAQIWCWRAVIRAAAAVLLIVMGGGEFLGGGSFQWAAGWLIWMRRVSLAGCERVSSECQVAMPGVEVGIVC